MWFHMFWPKPFLRGQFLLGTVVLVLVHCYWKNVRCDSTSVHILYMLISLHFFVHCLQPHCREGRLGGEVDAGSIFWIAVVVSTVLLDPPLWTPTYCYSTVRNTQLTIDHLFLVDVAFWLFKKSTEQRHKCKLCPTNLSTFGVFLFCLYWPGAFGV